MKVDNHWLDEAVRLPYPEGPAMRIRRFLVIHFTAGATAKSSVDFWRTPAAKGAEAHIIIDRDGTLYQVRATNQRADHAGRSAWVDPRTGKRYSSLNSCSIGIELANAGPDYAGRDAFDWAKRQPGFTSMHARHKNGGPVQEWECFPEAQYLKCEEVAKALVARYNLDDVVGHDDISPDRKNDPGPAFPMLRLREACGFTGMPAKLR